MSAIGRTGVQSALIRTPGRGNMILKELKSQKMLGSDIIDDSL